MPTDRQSFWTTMPGLLTGVAALITALVGVAGLVLGVTKDTDPPPQPPGPTPTTSTSAPGPTTTPPPEPPPTPDPAQALIAALPADIDPATCQDKTQTNELPDDGAVAYLACGGSRSQSGPTVSYFYRYPTTGQLSAAFLADAARMGLTALPADGSTDCPWTLGHRSWVAGSAAGNVGCYIDSSSGWGYVFWTQQDVLAEAHVGMPDGANGGLQTLWTWLGDPAKSGFRTG